MLNIFKQSEIKLKQLQTFYFRVQVLNQASSKFLTAFLFTRQRLKYELMEINFTINTYFHHNYVNIKVLRLKKKIISVNFYFIII